MTTIGRRSGKPHEIEIWFGVIDDTMYLISGNGPIGRLVPQRIGQPTGVRALGTARLTKVLLARSPTPTNDDASAT